MGIKIEFSMFTVNVYENVVFILQVFVVIVDNNIFKGCGINTTKKKDTEQRTRSCHGSLKYMTGRHSAYGSQVMRCVHTCTAVF